MTRVHKFAVVGLALAALCCTAKYAQAPKAMQLHVSSGSFGAPRIHMAKSMPPQFIVALSRDMPTAGWSFEVDTIEVNEESRRIVAKVTQRAPKDMAAQVLTPTWLKLNLGTLGQGHYFLELYVRDDADSRHQPAHAVLLEAK